MEQPTLDMTIVEQLRKIQIGNDNLANELIYIFLCSTPLVLDTLIYAIVEGDDQTMSWTLSRLKGSCSGIGAVRLATLCEDLECTVLAHDDTGIDQQMISMYQEYDHLVTILGAVIEGRQIHTLDSLNPADPRAA